MKEQLLCALTNIQYLQCLVILNNELWYCCKIFLETKFVHRFVLIRKRKYQNVPEIKQIKFRNTNMKNNMYPLLDYTI